MNILLTGAAGFIGHATFKKLLRENRQASIVGLDCINNYYDPQLKLDRLTDLNFHFDAKEKCWKNLKHTQAQFSQSDICDKASLDKVFETNNFDVVCHLAAQAGVRYSIENPAAYVDSNVMGFLNILESAVKWKVPKMVYASSSSVYGSNSKMPFSVEDTVDNPVSLYAATKKSNELMAHVYSHMYGLETIGLRFFTVYGPWGRPDMAPMLFSKAITQGNEIKVFNNGKMKRDFTYIADIVEGIIRVLNKPIVLKNQLPYRLYNIGRGAPVDLMHFIGLLEENLGKPAQKKFLPMQSGDVEATWADISDLKTDYGYSPQVSIEEGIREFSTWYTSYYKNTEE